MFCLCQTYFCCSSLCLTSHGSFNHFCWKLFLEYFWQRKCGKHSASQGIIGRVMIIMALSEMCFTKGGAPYSSAHCQVCFDLQGNGNLLPQLCRPQKKSLQTLQIKASLAMASGIGYHIMCTLKNCETHASKTHFNGSRCIKNTLQCLTKHIQDIQYAKKKKKVNGLEGAKYFFPVKVIFLYFFIEGIFFLHCKKLRNQMYLTFSTTQGS